VLRSCRPESGFYARPRQLSEQVLPWRSQSSATAFDPLRTPIVRCSRQKIESSGHAPPELRGSSAGPIVTVGPQRCGADGTGGVMVFNPEGMRIGELSSGAWRAGMSRPRRPPAKLRRAIAFS
jgi:hypothetical protein